MQGSKSQCACSLAPYKRVNKLWRDRILARLVKRIRIVQQEIRVDCSNVWLRADLSANFAQQPSLYSQVQSVSIWAIPDYARHTEDLAFAVAILLRLTAESTFKPRTTGPVNWIPLASSIPANITQLSLQMLGEAAELQQIGIIRLAASASALHTLSLRIKGAHLTNSVNWTNFVALLRQVGPRMSSLYLTYLGLECLPEVLGEIGKRAVWLRAMYLNLSGPADLNDSASLLPQQLKHLALQANPRTEHQLIMALRDPQILPYLVETPSLYSGCFRRDVADTADIHAALEGLRRRKDFTASKADAERLQSFLKAHKAFCAEAHWDIDSDAILSSEADGGQWSQGDPQAALVQSPSVSHTPPLAVLAKAQVTDRDSSEDEDSDDLSFSSGEDCGSEDELT